MSDTFTKSFQNECYNVYMFTCLHRIDIQDCVCRYVSEPNEYNREVNKLRQLLISKFDRLDQLRKSDILSDNKSDLLVDLMMGHYSMF